MTDIVAELRADIKRILARNFGLPNELAAIKISTVQRIADYVEQAEARTCRCQEPAAYAIPTRRDRQCDAQLTLERFRRMAAEEGRA